MQVARLKAEPRTGRGRNVNAQLRQQGWLPAVLYGEGKVTQSISISEWEIDQHIKHHHKVYRLEIDGTRQDVYLQDIQFDALTDRPMHADFKRIDLNKPIELEVEIGFLGHPVGLGKGGVLIKDHPTLRIRCLPMAIPEELPVNIAQLDIEQSLQAREVPLPPGIELAVAPEMVVCHVAKVVVQAAPVVAEVPAEAVAAEGAEPAKGEAKPEAKPERKVEKRGDERG